MAAKLGVNLNVAEELFTDKPSDEGFYSHDSITEARFNIKSLFKRFMNNLFQEIQAFGSIGFFPFYLLAFLGLGLFKNKWDSKRRYNELFLFSFFLPTFLIVAVFYIRTRYLMPALPILIIWISNGIANFEDWLVSTFRVRKISLLKQLPAAAVISSFLFIIAFQMKFNLGNTIEYKELGLWIRKNLPKDIRIITRDYVSSFYSERDTIHYPDSLDIRDILKYGIENNARYLVVDNIDWMTVKKLPQELEYLLQTSEAPDFFKVVYENYRYGRRLIMYEMKI